MNPVQGRYAGQFETTLTLHYPGVPAPMNYVWQGDIGLDLDYAHATQVRTFPSKAACDQRDQQGLPKLQICDHAGEPAIVDYYQTDEPRIDGSAHASMHMDFALAGPKGAFVRADQNGTSAAELHVELPMEAVKLNELLLTASRHVLSYTTQGTTDSNFSHGEVNDTVSHGQTELSGNVHATTPRGGSVEAPVKAGPIGSDRYDYRPLFRLQIHKTGCGYMRGELQTLQDFGTSDVQEKSEWRADLDGRDPAFEDAVDRYAAEPIPPRVAESQVQEALQAYERFRGDHSPYRECVALKARQRVYQLGEQYLRGLMSDYPAAVQAAADGAAVCALGESLITKARSLAFFVGSDCPLAGDVVDLVREQGQAFQQRTHTQLHCRT
jgi:hypothetical protein